MPTARDGNNLAKRRCATLVLRLVLSKRGQLLHGELVDVSGVSAARFAGWSGLVEVLRAWLASQAEGSALE